MMLKYRIKDNIILKTVFSIVILSVYYLEKIIPRNKKKWIMEDTPNPKYLYYLINKLLTAENIQSYILIKDKGKTKQLQKTLPNAIYAKSIRGIYHLLTCSVFCIDHALALPFPFMFMGGVKIFNLWHGIGIKKMGAINSKKGQDSHFKVSGFKRNLSLSYLKSAPTRLLGTSPVTNQWLKECFAIEDCKMLTGMYPRCEFILQEESFILDYLNFRGDDESLQMLYRFKNYNNVYLYMPTFRDKGNDFIEKAKFDFNKLNDAMIKVFGLFVFKLHPNTRIDLTEIAQYSNLIILPSNMDIYPLIKFTTVLITDYSSIYFDYILLPLKKILLFPFDKNEYLDDCREFYFDYEKDMPAKRVYSFSNLISSIVNNDIPEIGNKEQIIKKFWGKQESLLNILDVRSFEI